MQTIISQILILFSNKFRQTVFPALMAPGARTNF